MFLNLLKTFILLVHHGRDGFARNNQVKVKPDAKAVALTGRRRHQCQKASTPGDEVGA